MNSGGIIGCFIFDVFFGFLVGCVYTLMKKNNNSKYLYICSYLIYVGVMSTYNYALAGVSSAVIVIMMILLPVDNEVTMYSGGITDGR